ncbi:hypothetical protein SBOR_8152 [Sclerotinia borealis F-4128]|uniref:Uncharacterized protein n=1 Tax=Sclerotinia borealis (strain F-4128) TaxID=1432307 RepID=W9C3Z3_SCLBF|nr:hypothetical protein SBOR_8152 [Sclerotinia borealis F-4128]
MLAISFRNVANPSQTNGPPNNSLSRHLPSPIYATRSTFVSPGHVEHIRQAAQYLNEGRTVNTFPLPGGLTFGQPTWVLSRQPSNPDPIYYSHAPDHGHVADIDARCYSHYPTYPNHHLPTPTISRSDRTGITSLPHFDELELVDFDVMECTLLLAPIDATRECPENERVRLHGVGDLALYPDHTVHFSGSGHITFHRIEKELSFQMIELELHEDSKLPKGAPLPSNFDRFTG